jgi:monofunctional biosynthetic peptidoglycan transglycosylase
MDKKGVSKMFKMRVVILGSIAVWSLLSCFKTIVVASMDTDPVRNATFLVSKADKGSDSLKASKGSEAMDKAKELLIFDFTKPDDRNQWRPINDTVMGGVSASQLQTTKEGFALFTGTLSLENNGGFASLQSKPSAYDFIGYEGLAIRIKGDGKRYKFSLKSNIFLDSPRYEAVFTTDKGVWATVTIPFNTLVPTFRGTVLTNETPLDISKVKSFSFLISDKQAGPFRLEIDWVKAY